MTHEQRGLPRRVVRVRSAQGDQVGERHHRHVPRAALAGHGVRAAAPLHGRDRRRVPRVGLRRRAAPARSASRSRARRARSAPRSAPTRRCEQVLVQGRPRDRRRARERRRDRARRSSSRGSTRRRTLPAARRTEASCPTTSSRASRRFKFRGSSGKVNLALSGLPDFTCLPGHRAAPARRDLDQPEHRVPRARLRRREVRRVLAQPVHGHRHPVDDRSRHGAAGQARDVHLRAVRAVRPRPAAGTTRSARRSATR